jgi:hypothetical protein
VGVGGSIRAPLMRHLPIFGVLTWAGLGVALEPQAAMRASRAV